MDDIEQLLAVAAIRKTKATYWYAIDTKNWPLLATVFNENSLIDFRGERDLKPGEIVNRLIPATEALAAGDPAVVKGGEAFAQFATTVVVNWTTVHHGGEPIIDIIDSTHAKAIFPVFDYVDTGTGTKFKGWGHYHETYLKIDGRWTIDSLFLTRLRLDTDNMDKYLELFG